jgi:hypothetical protein
MAFGRNARRRTENRSVTYKRPMSLHPWARKSESDSNGSVWIHMKPRKILDQFSKGAGTIATQELDIEFIFLAPLNLNENIVHHWEAYESVASRLAQKVRSAVKLGSEISAMTNVFGDAADLADQAKQAFTRNTEGQSVEQFVSKAYRAVPSSRIPSIKVDTPLYYTNSDRRQIVFEFVLFQESVRGFNAHQMIIEPVQDLMKFSSPDLLTDINIDFPYMWDIRTRPKEFIKYSTCALVGVQPTWNSPYIKGYPSSVNLQLTFMDLSPLYAGTIEEGSIINVISKEKSDAMQAQNQLTQSENTAVLTPGNAQNRRILQGSAGL